MKLAVNRTAVVGALNRIAPVDATMPDPTIVPEPFRALMTMPLAGTPPVVLPRPVMMAAGVTTLTADVYWRVSKVTATVPLRPEGEGFALNRPVESRVPPGVPLNV